jgi:predicted RNA-binding protein with TRAM domain
VAEAVLATVFVVALIGGVGINAFLSGGSTLFGYYGYGGGPPPAGSPTVPLSVTGSASDQAVTINWATPASDGASPITGYVVYVRQSGTIVVQDIVSATTFTDTVSGLTNGLTYAVSVAAMNAVGQGPESAPLLLTPSAGPSAPTIDSVTPGDMQLTVNWSPPVSDGGSPLTGYVVDNLTNSTSQTVSAATTSATFTGLAVGTTYTFTVSAINAVTTGPASAAVSGTTNNVPDPPVINAAVPGDTKATVSYTAPANNGGSAITGYKVIVTGAGTGTGTFSTTANPYVVTGLTNGVTYTVVMQACNVNGCSANSGSRTVVPTAAPPTTLPAGYWLLGGDGGVFGFGSRPFLGSTGGVFLQAPVSGIDPTLIGDGYFLSAKDGGVFAYGKAKFAGSRGGQPINAPVVGMAEMPDGTGYWLVGSDGGVFAYGNAQYYGSKGGTPLNAPIVGIASTSTGKGYWLVAKDGGLFAYGDAKFLGSLGGTKLNKPIAGMVASPDGAGYWMVGTDGGVFAFNLPYFGSTANDKLAAPVVGIASSPDGQGYALAGADGGVFVFGDEPYFGNMVGKPLNAPIIGIT